MALVDPDISVCMPAARSSDYFTEALRSVLEQTYQNFEVVVVDDSGGDLRKSVEAFNDSRVRYQSNLVKLGFTMNHCEAIGLCRGRYIAFLHDDDLWDSDYLRTAFEALEDDGRVGMVICGITEVGPEGESLGPRPTRLTAGNQPDSLAAMLTRAEMLTLPSATVVRTSALKSSCALPWPDVIAGDMAMYVELAAAGWVVHHASAQLVQYRTHPGQLGLDNIRHRGAKVAIWERYKFDEPYESMRKDRLAVALIGRAGALLREGQRHAARSDLKRARQTAGMSQSRRRVALSLLTVLPPKLVELLHWCWSKVHDPFVTRHNGT